jgi:hypothetical protein
MSAFVPYKHGITALDTDPTGDAGDNINDNFKTVGDLFDNVTNASNLSTGTVAPARLGSGTASSTTALYGDSTYKTVSDATKLPLSGGTLTGNVNMGTHNVTNAGTVTATNFVGDGSALTSVNDSTKLPLSGGTMSGNLNLGGHQIVGDLAVSGGNIITDGTVTVGTGITFADSTIQATAALPLTGGTMSGNIDLNSGNIANIATLSFGSQVITMNGAGAIGIAGAELFLNGNNLSMSGTGGTGGTLSMDGGTITALASMTFADSTTQSTAALPLTGGQMGSGVTVDFNSGFLTHLNSVTFSDSTVQSTAALPLTGGTMSGSIDMGSISGIVNVADIVMAAGGPASIDQLQQITFNGNGTGITFSDSTSQTTAALPLTGGTMSGDIVVNGHSLTDIMGITFTDSTSQTTAALPLTGGTLSGSIDLSSQQITSISQISNSGGTLTLGNGLDNLTLLSALNANSASIIDLASIAFFDATTQSTAFIPTALSALTMASGQNIDVNNNSLLNVGVLSVTGALADGTYPCGSGSITITNGAITAIS